DDSFLRYQKTIMSGSNLTPPAAVQLCYEYVNGSCVKTPYFPVMISSLHFKQLHSPANLLISSLACADLVGTTVMPFSTVRSVESCWYFGDSFCKFHSCFSGSFCYCSIFHLCLISMGRCIAVTDPLVYPTRFTSSVSDMCITFSQLIPISFCFSLLYTGANKAALEELVSALSCVGGCQVAVNQSWVLVSFVFSFVPTLVMISVYSKIFLIAKEQARNIESLNNRTAKSSEGYKDRVARKERKAATTLGVAVILPYFIDSIIDAFLGFITPTYVYESLDLCFLLSLKNKNKQTNKKRKAIKLIVTGEVFRQNSSTVNLFLD
uniref:G-protein coupled receptors family 1 profile domain-containing protein n=1 Tax=Chinchilla lanigera TaxID=34839 RepID=A0A8C2W8R6_CHILA